MRGLKQGHGTGHGRVSPASSAGCCCPRLGRLQHASDPWVNNAGLRAFGPCSAPPGAPLPLGAGSAPPGVPVVSYPTYRLYGGDRVRIIVFGQDNLSRPYSVDTAGRIAFPLIGTVEARGLSTTQLASEIEGKLKKNYLMDPKVTVEVDAYRPFFVLGEVTKTRQYPYVNGMTVESAVAIAEGYSERANQRMVRRTRRFDGVMSTVMVPTDYPVQPDDTIYVLERFF
jgi:polysaccharide export outer membrane protein